MSFADWILVLTTALAWYHVGFVWLVQVVAWPLFGFVGPNEFPTYHATWWRGIRYILFIPSGLVFVGGLALLFVHPDRASYGLFVTAFAMTLLMWILTAVWWGPQQAKLTDPRSPQLSIINRSHWLRTALVSGNAIALLAALSQRLGG